MYPKMLRIKPIIKTRRKTNLELADWLRDCPQEHREYKYRDGIGIWFDYTYDECEENKPCVDVLIRRNHGEWEEPLIEVEG